MMKDIRLTQMTKASGCAAKIGPNILSEVLGKLPKFYDEKMLVGIETSDDAAVYKITEDIALIQTLDFFTPVVDDPYIFGQIAAANALSDVYAMGGEPKIALNIVAFPNCLDPSILGEILAGGADKVREAGAVLAGGHSIQDDVPKYGLSVTGFAHPKKLYKNYGCKPEDILILTKPVGSGIVNTAIKGECASDEALKQVLASMTSLNKKAKEVSEKYHIHACTDVTGFGVIGHGREMAAASDVTLELDVHKITYFENAIDYAKMGFVPAGAYNNRKHNERFVEARNIEEHFMDLLYDPQTSGGLLMSVSKEEAESIMEDFEKKHLDTKASVIGQVCKREPDGKYIRLI